MRSRQMGSGSQLETTSGAEVGSDSQIPRAAEAGRYDAFLSYAREDSEFAVDRLRAGLLAAGHEVWLDAGGPHRGCKGRRGRRRAGDGPTGRPS